MSKKPRTYLQDITFVDFYNRPIITGYSDEVGYVVPMKHIVEEHLGLDWKAMKKKMSSATEIPGGTEQGLQDMMEVNLFNPVLVAGHCFTEGLTLDHEYPEEDLPVFRSQQDYTCLPVEELNLFLAQISLNHVSPEVRENLYHYQKECGAALHDYWFRGMSVNTRTNSSRISSARHTWCPREMSSKSLEKGATRYATFAQSRFDSRLNPEEIAMYCKTVISDLLGLDLPESDSDDTIDNIWDNQEGTLVFLLAFLERAAFDILYFSIEANVSPEDLQDVLERNLLNAWENMGSLVISVQSPYTPFPGVGRGSARELV